MIHLIFRSRFHQSIWRRVYAIVSLLILSIISPREIFLLIYSAGYLYSKPSSIKRFQEMPAWRNFLTSRIRPFCNISRVRLSMRFFRSSGKHFIPMNLTLYFWIFASLGTLPIASIISSARITRLLFFLSIVFARLLSLFSSSFKSDSSDFLSNFLRSFGFGETRAKLSLNFRGADVQPSVNLPRVCGNYFPADFPCKLHGIFRLSGRRWPKDDDEFWLISQFLRILRLFSPQDLLSLVRGPQLCLMRLLSRQ